MRKFLLLLLLFSGLLFGRSFLMPNEAFKPSATLSDSSQIVVDVALGEGIYLYEKDFKVSLKDDKEIYIKDTQLPKSVDHDGNQVYMSSPHVVVTLGMRDGVSGTKPIDLDLAYQGCSTHGLCYEPQTQTYHFDIDSAKLSAKAQTPTTKVEQKVDATKVVSETDSIANSLKSGNILLVLGMFFIFGLLLSLTPCVFPMIPIISSVIVAQGAGMTTKRAFFLSLIYVLAMSVAYTIAGVLAGLFGSNLQAALQTPWVIYSFSGIFVLLSLSMFDLYELQMPNFIQSKLSSATGKKGGILGVAIMGFLSALIVGPCVAAPLAGALVYIGQTGDEVLGGAALFMLSIGMGVPLIIVGTGAGKFMPRPGMWMDTVKTVFGVMMLGVAIWMLSRIVDAQIIMALWAVLALATGVHFGALEPLQVQDGMRENSLKKIVAVIFFIYGTLLFIGSVSGAKDMLSPLEKFTANTAVVQTQSQELKFNVVTNLDQLDATLQQAKGKKVILDFAADWCTACKEYDATTFKDKDVMAKMDEFVLIRADITANTDAQKAISKRYGVFGPPVVLFFDKDGKLLENETVTGYKPAKEFLEHLKNL